MSECTLNEKELALLSNIPFFNKKDGFDFTNYDVRSKSIPAAEKTAIDRFGNPAINDQVWRTNSSYLDPDNPPPGYTPPIIPFKAFNPETGQYDKDQSMWIKDGDSAGGVKGKTDWPEGRLVNGDAMETSKYFIDFTKKSKEHNQGYDYARDKNGNFIQRESDPYANIQGRVFEKILLNAEKNGYEVRQHVYGTDKTSGRPLQRFSLIDSDGNDIDVMALMIKTGAMAMHPTVWPTPDPRIADNFEALRKCQDLAKKKQLGVHNPEVYYRIEAYKLKKLHFANMVHDHLSSLEKDFNHKRGQNQRLVDEKHDMNFKIGDVWLNIPPTHLLITQLRTAMSIPLIGEESRPILTPTTNRTVIKVNLVFAGKAMIEDDLARILLQFRYVPINIVKSYDLWNKLKEENDFLKSISGEESGCVPVTMDSYTLYTIEGHPEAIGCTLEMSLFNPMPYFHNNWNEKISYIKYTDMLFDVNARAALKTKGKVILPSNKDMKDLWSETTDLEESIHPYNFLVEHELKLMNYTMPEDNPSRITIVKVDNTMSEKFFQLAIQSNGDKPFEEKDVVEALQYGQITEIAQSISLSYTNNFAWQPVIAYAVPTAQYIGPGTTKVAVNIKTDKVAPIQNILRSYQDVITQDRYGNFENRYVVQSALLDLADCNILTVENVVISTVEGKPGTSDINVTFAKTFFENLARPDNDPIKLDKYWGLTRITSLFDIPKVKDLLNKAEESQQDDSAIYKVKNSGAADIKGLNKTLSAELNKTLDFINKMESGSRLSVDGLTTKVVRTTSGADLFPKIEWVQGKVRPTDESGDSLTRVASRVYSQSKLISQQLANELAADPSLNNDEYATQRYAELLKQAVVQSKADELAFREVIGAEVDARGLIKMNLAPTWGELFGYPGKYLYGDGAKKPKTVTKGSMYAYAEAFEGNIAIINLVTDQQSDADIFTSILRAQPVEGVPGTENLYRFDIKTPKPKVGKDGKMIFQYTIHVTPPAAETTKDVMETNKEASVEELSGKDAKLLAEALEYESVLINKPYAAHRWFNRIDNFVSYNKIFSHTMGYWYSSNRLKSMHDEIMGVTRATSAARDYMIDHDGIEAMNAVYMKETHKGFYEEYMNAQYSPMNIARTIAYPVSRKDPSVLDKTSRHYNKEHESGKKKTGFIWPILTPDNKLIDSTQPFNKFPTCLLNENHFKGDQEVKDLTYAMLANNVLARKDFAVSEELLGSADGVNSIKVYKNNTLSGILKPDGTIVRASDSTMSDRLASISDQTRINDKVNDYGRSFMNYAIARKTSQSEFGSDSETEYSKFQENLKEKTIAATIPSAFSEPFTPFPKDPKKDKILGPLQVGTGGNINTAAQNGVIDFQTQGRVDNSPEYDQESIPDATKADLIQSFYHSEMPTIGMQNAFPTYKIYVIIDETSEYKYKLLDAYFDFRLLQDMMVIRDKNNPSHILKCRAYIDPRQITTNTKINQVLGREAFSRIESKMVDSYKDRGSESTYSFLGGRSPLRQGMRICVKLGYHSDPRYLDTVFIGTITGLSPAGLGLYEIEARGDGRELTVPASVNNASLRGTNFSDMISKMLRGNPSVVHFGKTYGTWIEKFSREHQAFMNLIMTNTNIAGFLGASSSTLGGAGVGAGVGYGLAKAGLGMTGALPFTVAMVGAGVGASVWAYNTDGGQKLLEAWKQETIINTHKTTENIYGRFDSFWQYMKGDVFNATKANTQLFRHMQNIMEQGHNPIDWNIMAFDIWNDASMSPNIKINNQKSMWDILKNIQRIYPNYGLDVRPYGSRSTLFLGDVAMSYFRTDDPLIAMAPCLIEMDNITRDQMTDEYARQILKFTPRRDLLGNIDISRVNGPELSSGIAPMVPFMKHHNATSWDNIISNNIRSTPERGWNSVVITKGLDGKGEPEQYVANQDLHTSALRRRFEVVDWTDEPRMREYYAMGLLKEGVERLYGGTLILKGNAKIEPFDKIHITDEINQMYGWIQVETVIHKFDSEMGFTTHVVPNMVCSVNDSAYQTLGDVRKRVGWGWFSNQGVWDLVTLGTAVALGATGVGLVASVGIMMAVEAAKAYAKQKLNVPGDGKGSFTSDDDTPGWINNKLDSYNWIEAAVDMKYSTIRDAGALGITRGVKNLSAAKGMSVLQMLGSIKSGTSIAVFGGEGKPSFFKRAQANIAQRATEIAGGMESAAAASKNWAAKSVLSKLTGEAATAFEELTTSKTLTAEQRLAKAKAAAKGYAAMSDEAKLAIQKLTGVTAEAEVIAKLETMLISEAAPTARMATLGKAFGGLKSTGMGLLTKASPILNTAFAFMMVKDVIGLLGSCEKFVVESATKGNMIVVSPLWHRDALMMAGLEGYRNTDAWIHMKGMYLNMKEVFSEAKKGLGEWEPTRLLGDIVSPSLDKTHYLQAQVTNNTAVLNKKGLSAIRDRKNSPTIKKVAALVKNEVNNINAKNKYKIEPELIYAIIEAESGWKGDAENKNKDKKTGQVKSTDRGLMQINSVHGQYSTFDPSINVNYGTSFISRLIDKNNGNIYNALREYNGGQLSKQGPTALAATEAYANKVMLFYNQYKKEGGL